MNKITIRQLTASTLLWLAACVIVGFRYATPRMRRARLTSSSRSTCRTLPGSRCS